MPYFTLVIPTFDRGRLLERALRTCVAQGFADWEAVVVDDASPTASGVTPADVVRRIDDPRVRLIRHAQNLGVCAARNTGVGAARGTWLIFHDDDDELVPGALQRMHDAAERAGREIHRLVFAYRDDAGRISPEPALVDGAIWEYRQYLEWMEQVSERTDFLNCIRRDVFDALLWPADRSREELFHLELARRFRTQCHSEVASIMHTDATNRFTAVPGSDRLLHMAPDLASQWIRLLNEHGEALKAWAPRTFTRFLRSAAINSYMGGNRARGLRYSTAFLRYRPFAPSAWAVLMLGLLGRRAVVAAVALGKRWRVHAPVTFRPRPSGRP